MIMPLLGDLMENVKPVVLGAILTSLIISGVLGIIDGRLAGKKVRCWVFNIDNYWETSGNSSSMAFSKFQFTGPNNIPSRRQTHRRRAGQCGRRSGIVLYAAEEHGSTRDVGSVPGLERRTAGIYHELQPILQRPGIGHTVNGLHKGPEKGFWTRMGRGQGLQRFPNTRLCSSLRIVLKISFSVVRGLIQHIRSTFFPWSSVVKICA